MLFYALVGVPVRKLDGVRNERNMEWGRMLTLLRCSSMLLLGSQSGSLMGGVDRDFHRSTKLTLASSSSDSESLDNRFP